MASYERFFFFFCLRGQSGLTGDEQRLVVDPCCPCSLNPDSFKRDHSKAFSVSRPYVHARCPRGLERFCKKVKLLKLINIITASPISSVLRKLAFSNSLTSHASTKAMSPPDIFMCDTSNLIFVEHTHFRGYQSWDFTAFSTLGL